MTQKIYKSFRNAFNGFKDVLVFEHTFRVMLFVALVVIIAMMYFGVSRTEKAILLIMVFVVLILELVNSVIERVLDFIHIGEHADIKEIKDLMASIVLVVSLAAFSIGTLIFWPYVIRLFN